jgi:SAM-dependent methyltransferase
MTPNPYDQVPYASVPFAQTHPDRLATIASIFGVAHPSLANCRVLELGCAAGGNLIPLAEQLPDAEGVGIDLSTVQIAEGRRTCAALGLDSVKLVAGSIAEIDDSWGGFDFIVCHGVYSWVPPDVQQAILNVCRSRLRPNGIAYVSYNTLPGWHWRAPVRDLMRQHAMAFDSPEERIAQARAILNFLGDAVPAGQGARAALLHDEIGRVQRESDAYLYHEHLEADNEPLYFREFVRRAGDSGLKYLAESDFRSMVTDDLPPDTVAAIRRAAPGIIDHEQLLDFIRQRSFRQTLLIHDGVRVERRVPLGRVDGLRMSSGLVSKTPELDLREVQPEEFVGPDGDSLIGTSPLSRAAMRVLAERWPENLAWPELLALASERVTLRRNDRAAAVDLLRADLLKGFGLGLIGLHSSPAACTATPGERPRASRLAQHQAGQGSVVTTLRHRQVTLSEVARALLIWADGSRDRDALRALWQGRYPEQPAEAFGGVLVGLVRQGLMLAGR